MGKSAILLTAGMVLQAPIPFFLHLEPSSDGIEGQMQMQNANVSLGYFHTLDILILNLLTSNLGPVLKYEFGDLGFLN